MVVVLPRVAPSAEQGGSDAPVVCQTWRGTGYFAAMHSGRGGHVPVQLPRRSPRLFLVPTSTDAFQLPTFEDLQTDVFLKSVRGIFLKVWSWELDSSRQIGHPS